MLFPDEQRQIERDCVEQESLENVVAAPQVRSPHSSGFVHMSEASLDQFRPPPLESLAPLAFDPPTIPVYPVPL